VKIIRYIVPVLFAGILFSSCQPKDTISIVPAITFNSFTPYADSAVLIINFQDGDGDIGHTPVTPGTPFDYWGEYLYQDSAKSIAAGKPVFIPLYINKDTNDPVFFNYHIPSITPTGKDKELKGIIKVKLPLMWFNNQFIGYPNIVEYKVWILDRAGHKSNVIYTPPVNTQAY
jgi:hypothetical protein